MSDDARIDVAAFDRVSAAAAEALLAGVSGAAGLDGWRSALVAGRPYSTLDAIAQRSDELLADHDADTRAAVGRGLEQILR